MQFIAGETSGVIKSYKPQDTFRFAETPKVGDLYIPAQVVEDAGLQHLPKGSQVKLTYATGDDGRLFATGIKVEFISVTVKFFNEAKGFGFVTTSEGRDAFLHVSVLDEYGYEAPESGETLVVALKEVDAGLKVFKIKRPPSVGKKRVKRFRGGTTPHGLDVMASAE